MRGRASSIRALGDLREVVLAGEEVQAPRLERGDVEEGVDQAAEARDPRIHCDERLALHRRERAELLGEEELEVAHRRRHRRRELVAQVAEELAAQARELLEPLVGLDELGHLALEALDDALRGHAELHVARVRRTLLVAAEEALDLRGEAAHVDRLLDEAIAAHGEARLAVAFGRDRHDRHARERVRAAQAQRDLVAVEVRDVQIDDDQIRRRLLREAHALEAARRVEHLVTRRCEDLAHEQAAPRVVLDVEDLGHPSD
jgi:hypothetical protein